MADLWGEARIERGGQSAFGSIELRAELVAAGHGLRTEGTDQAARAQLVFWITHGELPRHCERIDLRPEFAHRGLDGHVVERFQFLSGRVMTAANPHDESPAFAPQAGALDHRLIKSHEDGADRAEPLLHD